MKFIDRLGYYLGGFAIGLIFLAFFLSGKRSSCNYFPDARVLEDIRSKEQVYSNTALAKIDLYKIDTAQISVILQRGDIDFSRSNTDLDSCNIYLVTGEAAEKNIEMSVQNCDSIATLQDIVIVE